MAKPMVLIVEDDSILICLLTQAVNKFEYTAVVARSGGEALGIIASKMPALILLDLGLPDMDGTDIIRSVRKTSAVPIIVVSARDKEQDKVDALDLGADDYVTKPFDTRELLARMRAAMRHYGNMITCGEQYSEMYYHCGDLFIDHEHRRITLKGKEIHLTQNEYKIIELLSRSGGKVLTHNKIIDAVWGSDAPNDTKILRVNIANIRRKLKGSDGSEYIITEPGIGYRMPEADHIQ